MNLSQNTQRLLSNLIATIAEGEKKTEIVRQVLAEQQMFEPYTAFNRINQDRSGQMQISDIFDFMADNRFLLTEQEAKYLYRKLDSNRDGIVTYPDFVKSILPKEDVRLRQLVQLRDSYFIEVNMLLPYEIEWALSRILEQELFNFRQIRSSQDMLQSADDFNQLEAFRCIDRQLQGFITLDELHEFTKSHGNLLSTDEILAFFRVVDLDEDGHISYPELIEAIISQSNINGSNIIGSNNEYQSMNEQQKTNLERERLNELNSVQKKNRELERQLTQSREKEIILQEQLSKYQVQPDKLGQNRGQSHLVSSGLQSKYIKQDYNLDLRRDRERQSQSQMMNYQENSQINSAQKRNDLGISKDYEDHRLSSKRQDQIEKKKLKEHQESMQELNKSQDKLQKLENEIKKSRKQAYLKKDFSKQQTPDQLTEKKQQIISNQSPFNRDDSFKMIMSRIYQTPKKQESSLQNKLLSTSGKKSSSKVSPMKGHEEHHLVMAMKEQIVYVRDLEDLKGQLSYKPDFHPQSAFQLLDKNNRRHLSKLDFELALNDLGLFPTTDQIRLFFNHYCHNTTFLMIDTFMEVVQPQVESLKVLMLSRPVVQLSPSTRSLFKDLLKKLLHTEEHLEYLRQKLHIRTQFNVTQAYQALDRNNQGFITPEQFKEIFLVWILFIFQKNGVFITNSEVDALVSIYDKNKDGKISYQNFIDEISPKRAKKI